VNSGRPGVVWLGDPVPEAVGAGWGAVPLPYGALLGDIVGSPEAQLFETALLLLLLLLLTTSADVELLSPRPPLGVCVDVGAAVTV
jgi:hypothetical protein